MSADRVPSVSQELRNELTAAAQTLYESADHITNLARSVGPDLPNAQWIIKQAYRKLLDLARRFEIEV